MDQLSGNPISLVIVCCALSLLPFVLLCVTSFVKISVVLMIFRNALGAQQVPSGMVVSVLALVLSLYVMEPTLLKVSANFSAHYHDAVHQQALQKRNVTHGAVGSDLPISVLWTVLVQSTEPVSAFVQKHTHPQELKFFTELRRHMKKGGSEVPATAMENVPGFFELVPAFLISQLQEAFLFGFTVFLPFLVVDVLVASVLMGMGMIMVSPVSISLPLKLLLFVLADGWSLLCKGLVLGYVGGGVWTS